MKNNRVGMTFHRTFPLSRNSLSCLFSRAGDGERLDRLLSFEDIRDGARVLGKVQIPAMYGYAVGSFIAQRNKLLTRFGACVVKLDDGMSRESTQWLMHYHLSAPQGPGPLFWHLLVTRSLWPGRVLSTAELGKELAHLLAEAGQPVPKGRGLRSTVTAFLGSYAKSEGLSALRLIRLLGAGRYQVQEPARPPLAVLAYALADLWRHFWPEQRTINEAELVHRRSWAGIFFLSESEAQEALAALRREGLVDLFRGAPPYQVVRLWALEEDFLGRVYAE